MSSLIYFRLFCSNKCDMNVCQDKKLTILSYVLPLPFALQVNQLSIGFPSGVRKVNLQKEKPVQLRSSPDRSSFSLFSLYIYVKSLKTFHPQIFMMNHKTSHMHLVSCYGNIIPVGSDRLSHDFRHFELKNDRKFVSCTQRGLNEHCALGK